MKYKKNKKNCNHKGLFRELKPRGENGRMQCLECDMKFCQDKEFWRDKKKVDKLYGMLKEKFG